MRTRWNVSCGNEVRVCGSCGRPNPVPPREELYEVISEGPVTGLPVHPDVVYKDEGWKGWHALLGSDNCCDECGAEPPTNASTIN